MEGNDIDTEKTRKYRRAIVVVSVLIPLAVAILFGVKVPGYNLNLLPPIYAAINGITAVLLMAAIISIRNGHQETP